MGTGYLQIGRVLAVAGIVGIASSAASAADSIKVGFLSTLSGPGAALGADIRDGFQLAVKHAGGKLGDLDTTVIVADDHQDPTTGRQAVDRLLKRDHVDVMTGMVFSNVLLPVMPSILGSDTVYISTNTGPAKYAGAECNKNFFVVSWENEDIPAAMGQYVSEHQKDGSVFLIAPDYPGGRESIGGFKRLYKGKIAAEVYTKLGQLDYSAELAQARASGANSVFFFLPGGMGVSFIKQFDSSGLNQTMKLYMPGFSGDQDTIVAVGQPMKGSFNSAQWGPDFRNPQNERFVADFQKEYGRIPTLYASQGYDAAMLIDGAARDVKGNIKDKAAFRTALAAANFKSVRGNFKFNVNHYPIQDYYLREIVTDTGDAAINKTGLVNKTAMTILKDYHDPFAHECRMEM
ncbi:MAG TPA: ABC transporter substrate-binding protein [Nevskiaceae bacterium]